MTHHRLNGKRENDEWTNATMWKVVFFLNFCSVVLPHLLIWTAEGTFAVLSHLFPK